MKHRPPRNSLFSCLSIASALVLAMGFGAASALAQEAGADPASANPSSWVREQQVLVLPRVVNPNPDSSNGAAAYAGTADDDNSPYAGTADNTNAPGDGTADASSGPIVVNPSAPAATATLADGSSVAPQAGTLQEYEDQSAAATTYGPVVVVVPSGPLVMPPTAYRPYYPYYSYPNVNRPYANNLTPNSPYFVPMPSPYPVNNLRPTYPSFAPAPMTFGAPAPWGRTAFGAPMASHPFVSPVFSAPRAGFGFRVR